MPARTQLPEDFLSFLANNPTIERSTSEELVEVWRAWARLYAPGSTEPAPETFAAFLTAPELPTPLASWHFAGQVRQSQQAILDEVAGRSGPLHIVAPPGAGKTLVGLLLAIRSGHRTLALAPTATIRHQWARTAASLAAGTWGEAARQGEQAGGAVSEDPHELGDVTALTYQMLSVVDSTNPFEALAEDRWVAELVEGGREAAEAAAWVADLRETNRAAFARGITRRARAIRRDILREDPTRLEDALHPNARELIDRIADAGIATIILDECHHLLDHWALVIHCLVNKLRARGITPLLIGLTATLPSVEDGEEYENYTGLLGEVDYELPTPAVVKEGNLAPYRSFAWFVTPTAAEVEFINDHDARLAELIRAAFTSAAGQRFLTGVLTGGDLGAGGDPDGDPDGDADSGGDCSPDAGITAAFKADPALAEAAWRMLRRTAPGHELLAYLPRDDGAGVSTDQQIRLLARYALEVLLPDPQAARQWERIKSVLVDFGYHLTDRGIRRGRDPIDALLATTAAKDHAVLDVLRLERERSREQVRAVVVCDFAVHGHHRGKDDQRAGALRCHAFLASAPDIADMRPVLVTARHLRVPTPAAAHLADRLGQLLGEELTARPLAGGVTEFSPAAGSARVLAAVSDLMAAGEIHLIVGTRGLLGEGWDCPAVNTLIDLSAVTTSASTQQLRGRTLRLDPHWPEKVAHNWAITCLLERSAELDARGDLSRLHRKLSTVWGLSLAGTDAVVKGAEHTLSPDHSFQLAKLHRQERGAAVAAVNQVTVDSFPTRADTRARWRLGEPYAGIAQRAAVVETPGKVRPFRSGMTLKLIAILLLLLAGFAILRAGEAALNTGLGWRGGALVFVGVLAGLGFGMRKELRSLWRQARQFALPLTAYQGAALAIAATLARRGDIAAVGTGNVRVAAHAHDPRFPGSYEVTIEGASQEDQAAVLETLTELFAPITSPRFVLEIGTARLTWGSLLSATSARIAALLGYRSRFFALPRAIARRREDAQFFASMWAEQVGPCVLHEISSPADMAILTRARKQFSGAGVRAWGQQVWS